ncbi:MAG TPA: 2-dehydropantoate 2-reductase [Clostridia bacterium]|nr:2-dehydropantoate 2-reductase [Clostridia bacterium]
MKIAVVGAGAMGSLFGGLLSISGEEVWLVDPWKEHMEAVLKKGLHIKRLREGDTLVAHPKAVTSPDPVGPCDLVLIFVKSYVTSSAMRNATPLIGVNTYCLTLQNGLGNIEAISEVVTAERILAGVTAHGATMVGPGEIVHAGQGKTIIGWPFGAEEKREEVSERAFKKLAEIAEAFLKAGIETDISENILVPIWEKLLVNVGINALTAILRIPNGALLAYDETKDLVRMAVEEAASVAKAKGVPVTGDIVSHVYDVAERTGQNKSSMLQDIIAGRKTEIGSINGMVVSEGKKLGVPVPVNEVLTDLIKALEKRGLEENC